MLRHCILYIFTHLLLLLGFDLYSQEIKIEFKTDNPQVTLQPTYTNENGVTFFLVDIKDSLNKLGYLEAGVDSINKEEARWLVYFHIGNRIEKVRLIADNEIVQILESFGTKTSFLNESTYTTENILFFFDKITSYWENGGFPFVSTRLNIIDIEKNIISAKIIVDKGMMIYFDSINISGDARVSAKFISALTRIKHGKPYNESLVKELDKLIRTLPFVKQTQASSIIFIGNKAKPMLYLEHKNNDFVDGIIGFAPPASGGTTRNQKLLITGEMRIKLGNMFRGGQNLDINLRFFNERSQEFQLKTEFPYIFGSNIGVELGGSGLKFDTLFSQIKGRIGFVYALNGKDKLKFFFENQGTSLISVDTNQIKSIRKIPENQSMAIRNYGIEATSNRLDYNFNPRKGYKIEGSFLVGTKSIRRDNRINSLSIKAQNGEYYNIYDSMQLNSLHYRYHFNLEKYLKIGSLGTFKTAFRGEGIFSQTIYFNELIRFGGVYSLRGFNEQSLFATNYTMMTIEYRYLLSQNANLFAFWNGAYYEDKSIARTTTKSDYPFGFGFGANLDTGVGILTLAYALGRENNNPIRFQAGKFHFGLIGLF